jgi:hypothetical protein
LTPVQKILTSCVDTAEKFSRKAGKQVAVTLVAGRQTEGRLPACRQAAGRQVEGKREAGKQAAGRQADRQTGSRQAGRQEAGKDVYIHSVTTECSGLKNTLCLLKKFM